MKTETDNSVKDQNATCDNNMLPVVFWAHFRSRNNESDRMQRWQDGRNPVTIIEWVTEKRKELELQNRENYCMTNCGVIR